MKRILLLIASFVLSFGIVSSAAAQQQAYSGTSKYAMKRTSVSREGGSVRASGGPVTQGNDFLQPIPAAIAIPGTDTIGIGTKYQVQANHGGLHNIQVDPSNPLNIHAVVMAVPNVTAKDTTAASDYPNRNCYYVFSSNGGQTWTTPKAVAKTRGGFPDMVLRKKANGDYVPVIALHRNLEFPSSLEDFVVSLYMETGNPGDGNFVGMDANQTTGDGLSSVEIIWPCVAISRDGTKAYVVACYDNPSQASSVDDIQFGWFDITDAGPTSWSNWMTGPEDGLLDGYTSQGAYSINVSDSGTVGVAWVSENFSGSGAVDSERALFYSVTRDSGTNWTDQVALWEPNDSTAEPVNGQNEYGFLIAEGVDLVYQGEVPYIAFSAYDQFFNGATYYPSSGTLGIWSPKLGTPQGAPILLTSRTRANAYNTGTFSDGSNLSDWTSKLGTPPSYTDPQGPNLQYPTLAHPAGSSDWVIYFQTWVNNDTSGVNFVTVIDSLSAKKFDTTYDTSSYPYQSIYKAVSEDNGNTWNFEPVETNSTPSTGQQFDYRYPEVSAFLPTSGKSVTLPILFAADTAAGESGASGAGLPGWDIMDWYYQPDTLGAAPAGVTPGSPSIGLVLQQNYPNPSTGVSKIGFTLPDESNVLLTVEDVLGRPIATLVNGPLGPGDHSYTFNPGDLPDGVYSYTLRADGQSVSKSMSLIR